MHQTTFLYSTIRILRRHLVTALLVLAGAGCSLQEPVMPTWGVTLNVPLAEESFRLGEELLNDSTLTVQGSDSLIHLSVDGRFDRVELSPGDFAIGRMDTSHRVELGAIELNSIGTLSTGDIALGTVFPDLQQYIVPGQTVPVTVPDTTFFPDPVSISSDDFQSLIVSDGILEVTFRNDLPFPVGPNAAQPAGMEIHITDSNGLPVAVLQYGTVIHPGESTSESAPLPDGGEWIVAPMIVQYVLPVAQPTAIQLNEATLDQHSLAIESAFRDLQVDEAIARIDPQTAEARLRLNLNSGHELREALIERGEVHLVFTNSTGLDSRLDLVFPNLYDASGQPYGDQVDIPAGGSESLVVPMDAMYLADDTRSGGFVDSLTVRYTASTLASGEMVHVRSDDAFAVALHADSIFVERFTGFIAADTFAIDPMDESDLVDYEGLPTDIALADVDFDLVLANELYVEDLRLDIELVGYHEENGVVTDSARLVITDQRILPGQPGAAVETAIRLNGNAVADFLNVLPTRVRTSGQVRAGGDVDIATDAGIGGRYAFFTPLRFRIGAEAAYEGDVDTLYSEDIDADIRDAETEDFEEASLELTLSNGTPIGGRVEVMVTTDGSRQDLFDGSDLNPDMEFRKTVAVSAGAVDPVTGYVSAAADNAVHLTLTREEFRLFQNPPVRIAYRLVLDPTDGDVALRASDAVRISGLASVRLFVK